MLKQRQCDKYYIFRIVLFWINRECVQYRVTIIWTKPFSFRLRCDLFYAMVAKDDIKYFYSKNKTKVFSSVRYTNDIHLYSCRTVHITCLHLKTK
jgi:hypothetical protein